MKKRMSIILEYDAEKLIQREVVDLILESGSGQFSIPYFTVISNSNKHTTSLLKLEAFCRWVLRECTMRRDCPFYFDKYLHAMVEEWYHIGDPSE